MPEGTGRMDLLSEFIKKVSEKNALQAKYLQNWRADGNEKENLAALLRFFRDECGYTTDFIADAYLFINTMVMEETYAFLKTGNYRLSSFDEVNEIVYGNPDYMEKYMTGLAVSDYIWIPHIKMLRYFTEKIRDVSGENYLEIGPGLGQYLARSLAAGNFSNYKACDVSETSASLCNRFLAFCGLSDKCAVEVSNFFDYDADDAFDCIVMGEVLEHVEDPAAMLGKIRALLKPGGAAVISTVINAPTIDHIYLFRSPEEVLALAENAGFTVADFTCVTEGDVPLEKALKRRSAVDIILTLTK